MADKLTHQIIDALTRAAAAPNGLPLYAAKADPGLFPTTTSAKSAAQKCLTEELIGVVGRDPRAKTPRDLYGLTDKGWEFLLAAVNPKQVLEDFVRVLETRQGEVGELLDTARRMADSLQGLKNAVTRVLPVVEAARMPKPPPDRPTAVAEPIHGTCHERPRSHPRASAGGATGVAVSANGDHSANGGPGVTVSEVPTAVGLSQNWSAAIVARLTEHTGPTDCTLPELYRALVVSSPAPSIGEFHDCLRQLHAAGTIALHSWTGPLYAIPEPQFALLVGHGIAYYASLKG
ncbi:MAG: hypothetical protein RMJ56_10850 [Gemmataceae bacterium]|nr:hypothetical protein [Gemmata sp.]MDW8198088.1 hypothetical protein [Gemmataceae bacterium]